MVRDLLQAPLSEAILQRHFAPIIIAGGLWGLVSRKVWAVGAAFLASALFYPITLAVLGLTAVVHEVIRLIIDRKMPKGWWLAVLLGFAALGVMLLREVPDEYGSRVTAEVSKTMPIFYEDGRAKYWLKDAYTFVFMHHRSGLGHTPEAFAWAALALLPMFALAWRRAALSGILIIGVGLFIWALAILFPFHLYLPNRHVRVPMPIGFSLLLASLIPASLIAIRESVGRGLDRAGPQWTHWRGVSWPMVVMNVVVPIALVGYVVEQFREPTLRMHNYMTRVADRGPEPPRYAENFLRAMTPDTIVAGHPGDVAHIPLLTGRATIANRKTLNPYFPDFYHAVLLPRAEDSVRAYYAADWEDVDRLYDLYGVTAFYHVDEKHRIRKHYFQERPLRELSAEAKARLDGRQRVLADPPADRVIVRDEYRGITLIRVGPPEAARVRQPDGSSKQFVPATRPEPEAEDEALRPATTRAAPLDS